VRGNLGISGSILAVLGLVALAVPALAQHEMKGELGADFGSYGFTNTVSNFGVSLEADRGLSNQFLGLDFQGPVVNNHFAGYSGLLRVSGTQVRSVSDGTAYNQYISPELTGHQLNLSLFPERNYGLQLFTGRSLVYSVRYEASNRSEVLIEDPGLAVVRRYASEVRSSGIRWRMTTDNDIDMNLEYKDDSSTLDRQYDLDENRNIWVEFSTVSPGVAPWYNIQLINTIPDRDVAVYVDLALADTVRAGERLDLVVEEGVRELDFIPVGLNAYHKTLDVGSDMVWKIFFNDPPGSKDMDQGNKVVTGNIKVGDEGPFKNETHFEFNDGYEAVQRMDSGLNVITNQASYDMSPELGFRAMTTYSGNRTDIQDISHQETTNFSNMTSMRLQKPGGLGASLSHNFSKLGSKTDASDVNSTNNILNGLVSMPTNWNQHRVDMRVVANLLSDDSGYVNNLYSAELTNRLEFRKAGFRWRPQHQLKSTRATQQSPDGKTTERESRLMVEGERPDVSFLGTLKLKGQYDWRSRKDDRGEDIKNRYLMEAGVTHRFGKHYKFQVIGTMENELYGNGAADGGGDPVSLREDQHRKSLRLDLQAEPMPGMNLGINSIFITINESKISKYSLSLNWKIPRLKIPVRSYLISEKRELEGLDPQTLLQAETKLSYNFRQIHLVASHRLTKETLITEDYSYNEFRATVSRRFDIY